MPSADEKRIWDEVNVASRDLTFFALDVLGTRSNRVRKWRQNMEKSYGIKSLLVLCKRQPVVPTRDSCSKFLYSVSTKK